MLTTLATSPLVRALDSILVRPLKTWIRLDRDVSELRGLDDRDLRDIGINRVDIARIPRWHL